MEFLKGTDLILKYMFLRNLPKSVKEKLYASLIRSSALIYPIMSKQSLITAKNLPSLKSAAVFLKGITYEEVDGKSY